jgi:predicted ester cyclase
MSGTGLPTPHTDLQTTKQTIGRLMLAPFPDMHSAEEDIIAEASKVVTRRTFRGTHQGTFMGIAPTGKTVTFTAIFIAYLTNGKIEEQWVNFDALGLLQQIGAIPTPSAAG